MVTGERGDWRDDPGEEPSEEWRVCRAGNRPTGTGDGDLGPGGGEVRSGSITGPPAKAPDALLDRQTKLKGRSNLNVSAHKAMQRKAADYL